MKFLRKLRDRFKKPAAPAPAAPSPEPQKEESGPGVPLLLLSVTPNGKVDQTCIFPPLPGEVAQEAAENFALLLYLIHSGQMLPILQKAVALGGTAGDFQQGFSHAVLTHLNELVEDKAKRKAGSTLVVPPRKVFGFHTNGND